ncbi:hypothetical protein [Sphingobacterium multivorum]|uniref:hypothetical protein n=1 Tax=Sphingobacterium multivorum TaxID=28454 RepID=UPI003DA5756F
MKRKPDWLQSKGYMHITPSLSMENNWLDYYRKITSPTYVANKGVKTTCTKTINTKSAKNVHFDAVKAVFD